MSHQDDWRNAGVTERLMENGKKDHTQLGAQTPVAPEARQVQSGDDRPWWL